MHPRVDFRTTTWQICESVPRRARIQGAQTFVSLRSRLESDKEEEEGSSAPDTLSAQHLAQVTLGFKGFLLNHVKSGRVEAFGVDSREGCGCTQGGGGLSGTRPGNASP